jgi:hypothetical protein
MKKILIAVLVALTLALAVSCGPDSYETNTIARESTLKTATTSVPVPRITNFLERQNVARRAKTMDQPDKLFYVYLFNYGVKEPIAFIVLKGKLSSLRSYLVPQERVYGSSAVLEDADIDGTYGENAAGFFGYTAAGAYFEWNMGVLVLDAPVPIFNVPDITTIIDKAQKK